MYSKLLGEEHDIKAKTTIIKSGNFCFIFTSIKNVSGKVMILPAKPISNF